MLAAGVDRGPLMGVPWAVKDVVRRSWHADDRRVRALPRDHMTPRSSAASAKRSRCFVGKTNLHELGWGLSPEVRTNNPHDPVLSAGGSSGGSAAAVAGGAIPIAWNDSGGSVRCRLRFCGVVGFQADARPNPLDRSTAGPVTLGDPGIIARSVADVAAVFAVLVGDEAVRPASSGSTLGLVDADLRRRRRRESRTTIKLALVVVANAGWTLEPRPLDLQCGLRRWGVTYAAELAAALRPWLGHA